MSVATDRASLLATIDHVLHRMGDDQRRLARQREILRDAATHLRTGRDPHVVMALVLEQAPELGEAMEAEA